MPVGPKGGPISILEFTEAIWQAHRSVKPRREPPRKLGIAVSGGVDSTALASLCSQLLKSGERPRYEVRAFIVDHGARGSSKAEAEMVKDRMVRMGLRTEILTLQWPERMEPSCLSDFETQARRLRYQALGRACQRCRIPSLLLAHHQDDQAETVLMRIANGHTAGLRGMAPATDIPECFGLYGVHRSGGLGAGPLGSAIEQKRELQQGPFMVTPKAFLFEAGGVKVFRPLLEFSKARLIETCKDRGIDWVEDTTNKDVTLTQRNTVRHLLEGNRLPSALQKPSLLALARKLKNRDFTNDGRAATAFNTSKILLFDVRSGSLAIRFKIMGQNMRYRADQRQARARRERRTARGLLCRVLELVSPLDHLELRRLDSAVDSIFPYLIDLEGGRAAAGVIPRDAFTCCGVYARKMHYPLSQEDGVERLQQIDPFRTGSAAGLDTEHVWFFGRQPFKGNSSTAPELQIIINSSDPPDRIHRRDNGAWHLWDGRFWIQVRNHTDHPLILRALQEEDLAAYRRSVEPAARKKLDVSLGDAAPGKTRWTLPILVDHEGQIIAFPTLGIVSKAARSLFDIDVRYKSVDIGRGIVSGPRPRLRQRLGTIGQTSSREVVGAPEGEDKVKS